jgi:hypothetical protein
MRNNFCYTPAKALSQPLKNVTGPLIIKLSYSSIMVATCTPLRLIIAKNIYQNYNLHPQQIKKIDISTY